MTNASISVVQPIYGGDDKKALELAVESVLSQSLPPRELVMVIEPPLTPGVNRFLDRLSSPETTIRKLYVEEGVGLGQALNKGVSEATSKYIARMDSDDFSAEHRFERQYRFLEENQQTDLVGSFSGEFTDSINKITNKKKVPERHEDIVSFAKFRNPINHPTVMCKREAILQAGNYKTVPNFEDYDLWVRMLDNGCIMRNIPEILVYSRTGYDFYQRRGGLNYLRTEIQFQTRLYKYGFIGLDTAIRNSLLRGGVRILPPMIRSRIYSTVRKSLHTD